MFQAITPIFSNGFVTNRVGLDERMMTRYENILTNVTSLRRDFLKSLMDPRRDVDNECGYPKSTQYQADNYQELFDREPIANRTVSLFPKESWQVQPTVYEDEDSENATPFEQAWDDLAKSLMNDSKYQDEAGNPIWEYLLRADVLSGIGSFGVILLGVDDNNGGDLTLPLEGVDTFQEEQGNEEGTQQGTRYAQFGYSPSGMRMDKNPVFSVNAKPPIVGADSEQDPTDEQPDDRSPDSLFADEINDPNQEDQPDDGDAGSSSETGSKGKRKLLYLRVYSESLVKVIQFEQRECPRKGYPLLYQITLTDPKLNSAGIGQDNRTLNVHWTRVIHVADTWMNPTNSEIFASPRMQACLNRILDLRKVYGAGAEGYWKQAFATLVLQTLPELGGDPNTDLTVIRNVVENFENGLQRSLILNGFEAKTLPPQVTDPTPFVQTIIEAICIYLGCPVRVFKGSERGELASSQDDSSWNDRIRARQQNYVTPKIIIPFIDRLIAAGILPEPKGGNDPEQGTVDQSQGQGDSDNPFAQDEPADKETTQDTVLNRHWRRRLSSRQMTWNAPPPAFLNKGKIPTDDQDQVEEPVDPNDPSMTDPTDPNAVKPKKKKGGYSVEWPDLDSQTDKEKADVFNVKMQGLSAYITGGIEALVPPLELFTKFLDMDEEEAAALIESGASHQEGMMQDQQSMMDDHGYVPAPPDGMIDPEQQDTENDIEMAKAENPAGVQQGGPPPFGGAPGGKPGKNPNLLTKGPLPVKPKPAPMVNEEEIIDLVLAN